MLRTISTLLICSIGPFLSACGPTESDASARATRGASSRSEGPATPAPSVASLAAGERAAVESRLLALRSQLELYVVMLERSPWQAFDGGADAWAWLMESGYGEIEPPRNPLSPSDVAARVVSIATPGVTGASIDPSEAGWVWNASDETLYAAGFAF